MSTESNNTRPYEEIDSGGLSPSRPALKRRKRGGNSYKRGNPFIALEASEGSDDEDQGGEGEEDGKNDGTSRRNVNDVVLGIELRDDSAPSHGLDFLPADAERLAMRFKEKAASSDAARFSGILEESIEQALLQPTIDDYEIHMVPLRLDHRHKGEAMSLVDRIYNYLIAWQQAYERGFSSKVPPKVSCIFVSPTDPNSLYVECRSPVDCSQLMSAFNYNPDTTLVGLEDRRALLLLSSSYNHPALDTLDDEQVERLSAHVWVRTCDGDIAYVVDGHNNAGVCDVLRLPMLPLKDGGSSRRLLQYQDILTLLDPKVRGGRYQPFAPTSNLFWITKKSAQTRRVFLGGLEQVTIPVSRTTIVDSPDPQDLLPFVEARETSLRFHTLIHNEDRQPTGIDPSYLSPLKGTFFPSDEFEWLTAGVLVEYADRFYASTLDIGDRVAVKESAPTELHGVVGSIVEVDANLAKIEDSQNLVYTIRRRHIRKVFEVGDLIRVISGPHRGATGMVLIVRGHLVHVLCGSMAELANSELSYRQSNSFTVPGYSLKLAAESSAPMSSKAKLVPCGDIGWNTLHLFELGDEVVVKQMKGVVERIDGDFYTIAISPGHSIMAHYSEIQAPQVSKRFLQHWLVGRNVLIINDSVFKGSHGIVKSVSFPEDHDSTQGASDETRGVALVYLSSRTVFHGSPAQSIPFRNIALDQRTETVPHITPVVPTVLNRTEHQSGHSTTELEDKIKAAERDSAKGAQWLIHERTRRYRTIYTFRLRHREGKSAVNAWTTPGATDSLSPEGQVLVEVRRTGRPMRKVLAPLTSLSLSPIQSSDLSTFVFTLYQAHDKFDIGFIETMVGVGPDAQCSVIFRKGEDPITIPAKFLVVAVSK